MSASWGRRGGESRAHHGADMPSGLAPLDLTVPAVAARVLEIQRTAYRVEAVLLGDDRIPPLHESLAELVSSTESFVGAHLDDGSLVGFVSYRITGDVLDIHRLAVDSDFVRRGVGRALLRWVLDGPGATVTAIVVSTGALNAPARALYGALGFTVIAEHEAVPGLRVVGLRLDHGAR